MNDAEYLALRRQYDDRLFMAKAVDPEFAPRNAPMVSAMRDALSPARWTKHASVLAAGLSASDTSAKTADNMLRKAVAAGFVERRGEYQREYIKRSRKWKVTDTRQYRLREWPTPDELGGPPAR